MCFLDGSLAKSTAKGDRTRASTTPQAAETQQTKEEGGTNLVQMEDHFVDALLGIFRPWLAQVKLDRLRPGKASKANKNLKLCWSGKKFAVCICVLQQWITSRGPSVRLEPTTSRGSLCWRIIAFALCCQLSRSLPQVASWHHHMLQEATVLPPHQSTLSLVDVQEELLDRLLVLGVEHLHDHVLLGTVPQPRLC